MNGVNIDATQLARIEEESNLSRYIKNLAVLLWGKATLKNRSFAKSPHKGKNSRPPLTPKKLGALKG